MGKPRECKERQSHAETHSAKTAWKQGFRRVFLRPAHTRGFSCGNSEMREGSRPPKIPSQQLNQAKGPREDYRLVYSSGCISFPIKPQSSALCTLLLQSTRVCWLFIYLRCLACLEIKHFLGFHFLGPMADLLGVILRGYIDKSLNRAAQRERARVN